MPPPQAIVCKICGGKFMKRSFPIHEPRCKKKFQMSHTQCDHCERWVDNSDWVMHRTDCKAPSKQERRRRAARAAAARSRAAARNGADPVNVEDMAASAGGNKTCEECEGAAAIWRCQACEQVLCAPCDAKLHKKGARARHARQPIGGLDAVGDAGALEEADFADRAPCNICGRKFNIDRIATHERICKKLDAKKKKRKIKVKEGTKLRTKGTEFEAFLKRRPQTPPEVLEWRKHGRRWRKEADGFREFLEIRDETQVQSDAKPSARSQSKSSSARRRQSTKSARHKTPQSTRREVATGASQVAPADELGSHGVSAPAVEARDTPVRSAVQQEPQAPLPGERKGKPGLPSPTEKPLRHGPLVIEHRAYSPGKAGLMTPVGGVPTRCADSEPMPGTAGVELWTAMRQEDIEAELKQMPVGATRSEPQQVAAPTPAVSQFARSATIGPVGTADKPTKRSPVKIQRKQTTAQTVPQEAAEPKPQQSTSKQRVAATPVESNMPQVPNTHVTSTQRRKTSGTSATRRKATPPSESSKMAKEAQNRPDSVTSKANKTNRASSRASRAGSVSRAPVQKRSQSRSGSDRPKSRTQSLSRTNAHRAPSPAVKRRTEKNSGPQQGEIRKFNTKVRNSYTDRQTAKARGEEALRAMKEQRVAAKRRASRGRGHKIAPEAAAPKRLSAKSRSRSGGSNVSSASSVLDRARAQMRAQARPVRPASRARGASASSSTGANEERRTKRSRSKGVSATEKTSASSPASKRSTVSQGASKKNPEGQLRRSQSLGGTSVSSDKTTGKASRNRPRSMAEYLERERERRLQRGRSPSPALPQRSESEKDLPAQAAASAHQNTDEATKPTTATESVQQRQDSNSGPQDSLNSSSKAEAFTIPTRNHGKPLKQPPKIGKAPKKRKDQPISLVHANNPGIGRVPVDRKMVRRVDNGRVVKSLSIKSTAAPASDLEKLRAARSAFFDRLNGSAE